MAYLATLEGDGEITLDDLFDVNDYLGVRYFGTDLWNKIKEYACRLTESAMKDPTNFCIHNINYRHKPSQDAVELLGFNDQMGVCAMGDTAWGMLKSRLDNDLCLGSFIDSIGSGLKKVGNAVADAASTIIGKPAKYATSTTKALIKAPRQIIKYATTNTPLKYTGGAMLYNFADEKVTEPVYNAAATGTQQVLDTSSKMTTMLVDETPLKYLPQAQLILKAYENAKEKAGLTSKGTSGVYESKDDYAARMAAAGAAASKAASQASTLKSQQITAAKEKQVMAEQQAETAQALVNTQQDLQSTEQRLTSKYLPIVMIGCFGLLALSLVKSKRSS